MTARRRTLEAAAAQERAIAALSETGDLHAAERLQRCLAVRLARRFGGGWPWTCRSPGCVWCRTTLGRRWWKGMRLWIAQDDIPVTLVIMPLPCPPNAFRRRVAKLRRACRDVRDRAARRRAPWRNVAMAGMATGDGVVFMLVSHPGIARSEVAAALRKRWPTAVVGEVGAVEPSWMMATEDAAQLARVRRGVEPLRIVVLPQRAAEADAGSRAATAPPPTWLEPMPVAF